MEKATYGTLQEIRSMGRILEKHRESYRTLQETDPTRNMYMSKSVKRSLTIKIHGDSEDPLQLKNTHHTHK